MADSEDQHQLAREFDAILAAARAGSRDALGQLLDHFQKSLRLQARQELPLQLRDELDSSDLVQETMSQAIGHFSEFRSATRASLQSWLKRILHNFIVHRYRQRLARPQICQREARLLLDASEVGPEFPDLAQVQSDEAASRRETVDRLRVALRHLPPKWLLIVRWRLKGLPWKLIGQRLDTSVSAVRHLWDRALIRLRQLIDDHNDDGRRWGGSNERDSLELNLSPDIPLVMSGALTPRRSPSGLGATAPRPRPFAQ